VPVGETPARVARDTGGEADAAAHREARGADDQPDGGAGQTAARGGRGWAGEPGDGVRRPRPERPWRERPWRDGTVADGRRTGPDRRRRRGGLRGSVVPGRGDPRRGRWGRRRGRDRGSRR